MKRVVLIFAWLVAVVGLYAGVGALDIYWNLLDWTPIWDLGARGILLWIAALLVVIWMLVRVTRERIAKAVAVLLCVVLAGLAIYLLPSEPVKAAFLGRESPSPLWYRAGRAAVLLLPSTFVLVSLRRWSRRRGDKE